MLTFRISQDPIQNETMHLRRHINNAFVLNYSCKLINKTITQIVFISNNLRGNKNIFVFPAVPVL